MSADSKRAAVKAWHAKRALSGDRKVTVWLSIKARTRLAELAKADGSKDRAAERAILSANPSDDIAGFASRPIVNGSETPK